MPQSKKLKILLLSDSIRGKSGVGTVANNIVLNSVHKFDWIHVAPERNVSGQLQKLDISPDVRKISGVPDANVRIIPYHDFGDINLIRMILETEDIDAILIFTDPRYWEWLFEHEREIRQYVPIIYYNIWDNYPIPYYNKSYYESVDSLIAISKLTEDININIIKESKHSPGIQYIPHGVNQRVFYPITEFDDDYENYNKFKKSFVNDAEFVVLYNSRNLDRKNPLDIINSFTFFVKALEENSDVDISKVKLILHTNPTDSLGANLPAFIHDHVPVNIQRNILFSTKKLEDKSINYLYNVADVTINLSHNEGWGLSVTESIMAGTPVIANVTGGMSDQMNIQYVDGGVRWGRWAAPVFPTVKTLVGSQQTPYIYTDRVDTDDVIRVLYEAFEYRSSLKEKGLLGRQWLIENHMTATSMSEQITTNIIGTIEDFSPRTDYDIVKI